MRLLPNLYSVWKTELPGRWSYFLTITPSGRRSYLEDGATWKTELPGIWSYLEDGATWKTELPGRRSYLEDGATRRTELAQLLFQLFSVSKTPSLHQPVLRISDLESSLCLSAKNHQAFLLAPGMPGENNPKAPRIP